MHVIIREEGYRTVTRYGVFRLKFKYREQGIVQHLDLEASLATIKLANIVCRFVDDQTISLGFVKRNQLVVQVPILLLLDQ
jgi:hypothetical protein